LQAAPAVAVTAPAATVLGASASGPSRPRASRGPAADGAPDAVAASTVARSAESAGRAAEDATATVHEATPTDAVRPAEHTAPDEPVTTLRVQLAPPLLGEVVLELRHEREVVSAHAVVTNPTTAAVLRQVETQVQQLLKQHGLQSGGFEVSCRQDGAAGDQRQFAPAPEPAATARVVPAPAAPRPVAPGVTPVSGIDLYA
jgi:hypothetical protein